MWPFVCAWTVGLYSFSAWGVFVLGSFRYVLSCGRFRAFERDLEHTLGEVASNCQVYLLTGGVCPHRLCYCVRVVECFVVLSRGFGFLHLAYLP